MSDKLSILWEHERGVMTREIKEAGKKVIVDLQIDRAFRTICPDVMIREAFLSALLTPLTDISEIKNRTAVIEKFKATPQMLDRLIELVRRVITAKNSWDSERSRIYSARRVNSHDKNANLWASRELLIMTAHYIKTVTITVRDIHETLNMFGCIDGWLGKLKDAAFMLSESRQAVYIMEQAGKLEKGLGSAHTYDIEFSFDEEMRADPFFLRDFKYIRTYDKPQKKQKASFFSIFDFEKDKEKKPSVDMADASSASMQAQVQVDGVDSDLAFDISTKAVQESDRYLTGYLRALLDKFISLENELYFYKAVLMYIHRFDERNVGYIYPEFCEADENKMELKDLSDVLLLTESMSVMSVIPNDVCFKIGDGGTPGILVTGKNNSGKTVYLRSVGTAVVLAQCGLPIPCRQAVISVRNRIFTTFAAAEGELVPLSSAGRFEEEVLAISQIIDEIVPCSLLLMNETFQTTAYDEGAEGMYHILNYITALGCGFVFVTHLTQLKELYGKGNGIEILKTSDSPQTRYKIQRLEA